ncbi:hypothetical protein [Pseudofrankia sp. BMG5.36]|uniref:hypothetical protein n=1 Tax=Pseudofrankia sp. BMG5.36 TaxID=1834512 RepID=UPI0008D904E4|nr:hypothetical protein [Pseudofrankia sp. BMG5.36]OHV43433.1 hypothetical protein BCD48_28050 [Pseudofrankia sp. BMG5.36]
MTMAATHAPSTAARAQAAQVAVVAGGLTGAVGAAAYISSFALLSDLTGREAVRSPLCVTANMLMALGFAVVALALPALAAHTRLPRWALLTAAAACLSIAAVAWGVATFGVEATRLATDAQWDHPGAFVLVAHLPKMLIGAAGFAALAVTSWRRRAAPRVACLLLGLTAAVALLLPPHQPTALLAGLGLAWLARTARPHSET